MRKLKLITAFVCTILFGSNLYGVDWSDFRGPKGNPVHDGELPLSWNTKNNENVAVTFFWPSLEKQVRILGKASEISREQALEYHNSRPRLSQIAAYTSTQSKELDSITTLDDEFRKTEEKFENQKIPLPDHWGGYKILVHSIEYWSGRPSRLHERVSLKLQNNNWIEKRLYP